MSRSGTVFCAMALLTLVALAPGLAWAADWYVVAGSSGGDGSQEKPFKEIHEAIDKAASGDVIHVAQGTYHGKLKVGFIVVSKPGLTFAGGYKDGTFAERNPFLYPTFIQEAAETKNESFAGGYVRTTVAGATVEHRGTTLDGFWFDRKGQNSYGKDSKSIAVPIGSNTKPVVEFESLDCHVRNCVFVNTALYGVRLNGDGCSVENSLFVNSNYAGIDVYGKGDRLAKGYPYWKFDVKNCTFFMMWNASSLELGAGSCIVHAGNADITISDCIFHLSAGNQASEGWVVKDLRNFANADWVKFNNNSVSAFRGGVAIIYDKENTASTAIEDPADLKETAWGPAEPTGNDREDPGFEIDKEWGARFASVTPNEDVSKKPVVMDHYNKMRRMFGLPLDGGVAKRGMYQGTWYPVDHVKTGAFWTVANEKIKSRGVQAAGPFPIVRAKLIEEGGAKAPAVAEVPSDRAYEEVEFDTLWAKGVDYVDKPVKFKTYWAQKDGSFAAGFGKTAKPYLDGATKDTHEIYALREVPEMDKGSPRLKGYLRIGSAGLNTLKKRYPKAVPSGDCNFSFVVRGMVRKAAAKLGGKSPQIVIEIDSIDAK